jgi:hypothetical protein
VEHFSTLHSTERSRSQRGTSKGKMGWYAERLLRWWRMKESPVGRGFASAAAAGSSTGTADAMARKDTLDAWRLRPSLEKWEAAGEGFLARARREQSIDGASWGEPSGDSALTGKDGIWLTIYFSDSNLFNRFV